MSKIPDWIKSIASEGASKPEITAAFSGDTDYACENCGENLSTLPGDELCPKCTQKTVKTLPKTLEEAVVFFRDLAGDDFRESTTYPGRYQYIDADGEVHMWTPKKVVQEARKLSRYS